MPSSSSSVAVDARQQRAPAFAVEHVDLRGPRVRADRDLRILSTAARGRQHAEVGERAEQVDLLLHARLRMVRADDHRVVLEERVEPAGRRHQPLELAVGLRQRVDLRERPVLVRVRVVVGEREEQEVEQVVLDHVLADAAGMLVADARQAELRAARRAARREDVGVEELLRPVHRVPEDLARDPGQGGVARHLVPVAAAVHQVRGPGGADVGVVEPLEHGEHVLGQVLEVHVVDRVGERLLDPERLRRAEARAVLDVAPLSAVVPVHRRDLVLVRADAGGDRRRAHRRHRRERRHAVVDVLAALHQRLQRRRATGDDRALEHRRLHRVDDDEDELLHRRILSPAYFSPARRRVPSRSHASAAITRIASGGKRIESPTATRPAASP